jgi:hypothetical protein
MNPLLKKILPVVTALLVGSGTGAVYSNPDLIQVGTNKEEIAKARVEREIASTERAELRERVAVLEARFTDAVRNIEKGIDELNKKIP